MTISRLADAKVHFFASHSWSYSHRREGLHSILWPWERGRDFQDYSISRAHPLNTDTDPELARELRDLIAGMDALLIMAGMYANNSPWMQFEIDMAFAFNVPIIPILANGQELVPRLPTRLATVPPVRWRGNSIREALLGCVSQERRLAIVYRVVAKQGERQKRAAEAARRSMYNALFPTAIHPPAMVPMRRNALAGNFDPQPTSMHYLSDLLLADLRRRR